MTLTMSVPVVVEVLAYTPSEFYHCTHCEIIFQSAGLGPKVHREQRESGLPEDLKAQFDEVVEGVHALYQRFGERVMVKVVDAASLEGFAKSLRHWAHRYPAYIVNGKRLSPGAGLRDVTHAVGVLMGEDGFSQ